MVARFDLDDSHFPLIVVTLQGEPDDALFERMFIDYERAMYRRAPYIMITDLRALKKVANAKQRQLMANRLKQIEEDYGSFRRGSILILESALVRGALTALQWLMQKHSQDLIVADMNAALQEAEKRADLAGMSLPATKRRLVGT